MAGYQLKTFVSIVAGMINSLRGTAPGITDYNVGSVARTMLEAPAAEVEEAYLQAFNGLLDAIPVATYNSFNFDRLEAAPASGLIRVTVTVTAADVSIPAGTVFSTPDSRTTFVSQAAATILAAASTADVTVIAATAGVVGNVPAGTDFTAQPGIANFVSATNLKLFNNGRDLEGDDERKQRFQGFITSLQRAVIPALKYGARTAALFDVNGVETERVKAVAVREPYLEDPGDPVAWVEVYIHNGAGTTSSGLVTRASEVIHGYTDALTGEKVAGYKAAGVKVDVIAATEVTVALTGVITASPGYDGATLCAQASDALARHLLNLDVGASSLYKDRVILVGSIEGVANIVFSVGTSDNVPTAYQKLMPGTITLTAA